jgi:hypothetical protein
MTDSLRVIVALPDATEREEVAEWLSAEHFEPVPLKSSREALDDMRARPFDLLIADDGFAFRDGLHKKGRARHPLTPAIVIGSEADEPKGDAVDPKTIYLARPIERAILLCYASMALLEGRPTRRSTRKSLSRFDAFANGVPSRLMDVSNEGLRIEIGADQRSGLPIYFNVRVPLIGVTVSVKRMWTRPSSGRGAMTWYGGALAENLPGAEHAWRTFVEAIPVVDRTEA